MAPSHGQHHSPLVEYQETGASSASKQLPVPGPPVLDPGLTSKTFRTTGEVKMQNQTKSVTQGEDALLRRRGDGGRVQVGGEEGPLPPSHNSTSIALYAWFIQVAFCRLRPRPILLFPFAVLGRAGPSGWVETVFWLSA